MLYYLSCYFTVDASRPEIGIAGGPVAGILA